MFAKFVNPWSNTSPLTLQHFSLKHALQGPVESAVSGLLPLDEYSKLHSGGRGHRLASQWASFGAANVAQTRALGRQQIYIIQPMYNYD